MPLLTIFVLSSCDDNRDIVSKDKVSDSSCTFASTRINIDVSNPEIFRTITKAGDTLTYYGDKNLDGTVSEFYSIEYATKGGIINFIDINEGYVTKVANNKGASIEFEWLSSSSAVVKAHSLVDNVYVSTVVDFLDANVDKAPSSGISKPEKSREGNLSLEIIPFDDSSMPIDQVTTMSSPWTPIDDMPASQQVWLQITRCEHKCDARNYLALHNSKTGEYICKFPKPTRIEKGYYCFSVPVSSFPALATDYELCESIDANLKIILKVLDNTLAAGDNIVAALNLASASTGMGDIPTVINDALLYAATASDYGSQIIQDLSGFSGLVRRTDSEWYFKSYASTAAELYPVALNADVFVSGDSYNFKSSESLFMTLDIQGSPMINSFELNPSCPKPGDDYETIIAYQCIPEGSVISISVVGTDGYKNLTSEQISGGGQAVLRVPGAEKGICDKCLIEIDMPGEQTIRMKASLVFGE